jgi:DDE superfamily endonuclease
VGADAVAAGKKNAARRHAALVFLDETGVLITPLLRRTWAPRGQTPVLYQRGRSRQKVSVIAALVIPATRDRVRCYFRLAPDASIDGRGVQRFVRALLRVVPGSVTLIWDRSNTHRGEPVKSWLRAHHRRVRVALLPPYAPELNPVELVWGYTKHNPLANCAPADLAALVTATRGGTHYVARRPHLLRALLRHTPLSLRLR